MFPSGFVLCLKGKCLGVETKGDFCWLGGVVGIS